MRTLLVTRKGGVGKTTAAAAIATAASRRGFRTPVPSMDSAHSRADAFDRSVCSEPTRVQPNLPVQQIDTQLRLERSCVEIQRYRMSVIDAAGVESLTAEEMVVFPGAEEAVALQELRGHATSDLWDLVVLDCAPTADQLPLLALLTAAGSWLAQAASAFLGGPLSDQPEDAQDRGVEKIDHSDGRKWEDDV